MKYRKKLKSLEGSVTVEPYVRGAYLIALNSIALIDLLGTYSGQLLEIDIFEVHGKYLDKIRPLATLDGNFRCGVDHSQRPPEEYIEIGKHNLLSLFELYYMKNALLKMDIYDASSRTIHQTK